MLERVRRIFQDEERFFSLYIAESTLAKIYFKMVLRDQELNFRYVLKNLFFILTQLPFAKSRAEAYLKRIIAVGQEVESHSFLHGQALLDMGLLLRLKGKKESAKEYFARALEVFHRCSSLTYSKLCQEALDSVS
jgi:tetratricopeptide (TPR) repeat protein